MTELSVTLDELAFPWSSQVSQYPDAGEPGVSYFRGDVEDGVWVDCLLWRDGYGQLRGILNYYPFDLPPYETAGNFNIFVDPQWQRNGIGLALITEADKRYRIDFERQQYTPAGASLVRQYLKTKEES